VRQAFEEVRTKAGGGPGILFIDEIDGVGQARGGQGNGESAEDDRTLNALLAEMDGFQKDNIIVIAATNRPDKLDPALLRGGRFGLKVPVGLPDIDGREAILKVHVKDMKLDADVDLREVAKQTPGLAGADLEHIVLRASWLAGDQEAEAARMDHFLAAIDEMTIGQQRKLIMSEEEKQVVAYHEAGHALMSHLLPNADPVRKVTIVPHGLNSLGLMQALPEEEKHIQSRAWLLDRMAVALGGRAAEQLMTGEVYSGAQNDLEQATNIAKHMVIKFGMSEKIGPVAYDFEQAKSLELSEDLKQKIEAEVQKLVEEAQQRARQTLEAHRDTLEAMAKELREKETLRAEDIERLIPSNKPKFRSFLWSLPFFGKH
jgi:cell division protease FtsH